MMKRMQFDSNGRLIGVDNSLLSDFASAKNGKKFRSFDEYYNGEEEMVEFDREPLRTSDSLLFLQESEVFKKGVGKEGWSLFEGEKMLEPLKFSNGKSQEDVVKEVVGLIKGGKKVVLLHGMCGTGKSAIALHIIRELGRGTIVVPVKGLQKQYEEDYTSKKFVVKKDGRKMKVAVITGRDNHDSIIKLGASCADATLPENIRLSDKNMSLIKEYYDANPLIQNKMDYVDISRLRRISIAPANPYWSPLLPADFEFVQFKDARKKKYRGLKGRDFVFYHRKTGCSYYDQYQSYISSDVLVFNSAKYLVETALDRRPETPVDVIDEADEFLDSFATQDSINLTRLANALKLLPCEHPKAQTACDKAIELLNLEEKNKQAVGIDENKLFTLAETQLMKLFGLFARELELQSEILIDEWNYANEALEIAEHFKDQFMDTYVTFKRGEERELIVNLVSANLAGKFNELINKSQALVLMSGTLHSAQVLKDVFGIKDFAVVSAETKLPGTIEIIRTGKEFDCKYSTFKEGRKNREDYLNSLGVCLSKAPRPVLVQVNAFEDLPSESERDVFDLSGLPSREQILASQKADKLGKAISDFKAKKTNQLFSTKCARGVDFPGDVCNAMVFTKYPNPNVRDLFWRVLEKTHPRYYWEFYKDKAWREFLQRIFRALRSPTDHVYILSPDSRVLDAVQGLQRNGFGK